MHASSPLPDALAAYFATHATIGRTPLARLLPMDVKTIDRHVAAGHLVGRLKGLGRRKHHRAFTAADVTRFLQTLLERSPFWRFDFQIDGYRFSGSTRIKNERDAQAFEDDEKAKAKSLLATIASQNSKPLTIGRACERWWNEHGQHLNDPDLKARLDWLVAAIGPGGAARDQRHGLAAWSQARRRDVRRRPRQRRQAALSADHGAHGQQDDGFAAAPGAAPRPRQLERDNHPSEPTWKNHALKETRRPVRELLPAEELKLDAVEPPNLRALRRFAIITGLRRRNLLLTWSQVDFEHRRDPDHFQGRDPAHAAADARGLRDPVAQRGHHPEFVFHLRLPEKPQHPERRRAAHQRPALSHHLYGLGSNRRNWIKAGVDRADPRPAPHHRHAHAAIDRQPARGAENSRPYRYRDHGQILHGRDRRRHAQRDGIDIAAAGAAGAGSESQRGRIMKVSLAQQIDEIDRELGERQRVYANLVASRKMRQSIAEFQVARLQAVRATLVWPQAWQGVKLLKFDCSRSNTDVLSYDGAMKYPDWPSVGYYTSSMDSALVLVPADHAWTVSTHGTGPFKYWASVCFPDENAGSATATAATPALALSAAALRGPQETAHD
jgi:hypothetical protein